MNVCFLGIILFIALLYNVAALPGPHHGSKMCLACQGIADPSKCTTMESCPERFCVSDVYLKNGEMTHRFSCHAECQSMHIVMVNLVGKRARGHDHGLHLCRACCDGIACEKTHCDIDELKGIISPTTKQPTTTAKTTTRAPTTTTTTTTTTPIPTTTTDDRRCQNFEDDAFRCSSLDKYNFCVDSTSIANAIAHDRCALHCGFCTPDGTLPPTTTFHPTTAEQTTQYHVPDTTSTVALTTTTTTTATTTTQSSCVDNEQQQFNCEEWKSFGFCDAASGVGHTIALERCQKTCGLCDK